MRKVLEQLEQAHGGAMELTAELTPTVIRSEDAKEGEEK